VTEARPGPRGQRDDADGLACCLCGKEAENGTDWHLDAGQGDRVRVRTTVSMETATGHQDGFSGVRVSYAICDECWRAKLAPWFEGQGAKAEVQDV
jgi:hypothetical protein